MCPELCLSREHLSDPVPRYRGGCASLEIGVLVCSHPPGVSVSVWGLWRETRVSVCGSLRRGVAVGVAATARSETVPFMSVRSVCFLCAYVTPMFV